MPLILTPAQAQAKALLKNAAARESVAATRPLYWLLDHRFRVTRQYCAKTVAADMPWCYRSLLHAIQGVRDFPADRVPALYRATQDTAFLHALTLHTDRMIVPRPRSVRRAPLQAVSGLLTRLGRLTELLNKEACGHPLTEEEEAEYDRLINEAQEDWEALRRRPRPGGQSDDHDE